MFALTRGRQVLLSIVLLSYASNAAFANQDAELHKQYDELIRKQDYRDALATVDKALALNPKQGAILDRRAECYNLLQQYDKAIADSDAALVLNSSDYTAYQNRANAFSHLGKTKPAIADYTKQTSLQPKNPQPYAARAYLFENFGKKQPAIDDYTKAIDLYRAHPPAAQDETARLNGLMMLANAFNRRGSLWSESNQFGRAVDDYSESIKQIDTLKAPSTFKTLKAGGAFSLSPSPYAGRAAAYEKLGKHELALADHKKLDELKKLDGKNFRRKANQ